MYCAGVPGLEPRLTVPESAGLPITPYPNVELCTVWQGGKFTSRNWQGLQRQSLGNTGYAGLFLEQLH